MSEIETGWHKDFRVNASRGWREKIGDLFRGVADEIDGRTSLAVRLRTVPSLTGSVRAKCLMLGLEHASVLITDSLRDACYDSIKDELDPALALSVKESPAP